jgi:hypothetical protein
MIRQSGRSAKRLFNAVSAGALDINRPPIKITPDEPSQVAGLLF